MKKPSDRMIAILKSKLNRYGKPGGYYYGGPLTYQEIKILIEYYGLKLNDRGGNSAAYWMGFLDKGINGSVWFYFYQEGNKEIFKELGLDE